MCCLLGAGGKLIGRKLQAKAKRHNQIRVLADSNVNTISGRISAALADESFLMKSFACYCLKLTNTVR